MARYSPNMTETVVIPTAGLGSRMGDTCKVINKALLPYRGMPMIGHIIERFGPDSRFVIPLGHLDEQVRWFVSECYHDRNIDFIKVDDYQGPGSGTATTLMQCRDHIDGPFFYVSCDTFWEASEKLAFEPHGDTCWIGQASEDQSERYTMMMVVNGQARLSTYKQRQPSPWMAFTGLMRIHNHQDFFRRLEASESREFVDSLPLPMNTEVLSTWKDMGTKETYEFHMREHDPFDFSKNDEITWMCNGKVVKWNRDHGETSKRFHRAQFANAGVLPGNLKCGPMLIYDRVDGNTGYHSENRSTIVDKLLPWLRDMVWKRVDAHDIKKASLDFYQTKTRLRLEKFTNKNKAVLNAKIINGISVSNWNDYLQMVDWHLVCNANYPSWIHGDMQPDNVIISTTDGSIRAIDWRSSFGSEPAAGDAHYDLAKLIGGCLIDYSLIKKNQFSVIHASPHEWSIKVPGLGDESAEQRILEFASLHGLRKEKILTLVPLIFWNMAPLHAEPFDDLLWCMGLLRFRKLYDA